jgi:hypothetical protein
MGIVAEDANLESSHETARGATVNPRAIPNFAARAG